MNGIRACRSLVVAILLALIAGCGTPQAPGLTGEWAGLLDELRAFERRIGFADTRNFATLSHDQGEYPFCGHVPPLTLPYSYEDPAITWLNSTTEEECRARSGDADVYFGASEALGEIGAPVTRAMITGKLDRFIYLVIHENCHDQFGLPYGIEEALCEFITYKAMALFSAEKYGLYAGAGRAIRGYAETRSARTHATIGYYDQLAALYARHERGEIPPEALLRERTAIFETARKQLDWSAGELNNVAIANRMTYSRHYPLMESVFDALGRDPARMVAFFRQVDRIKPSGAQVMEWKRIVDERSLAFVRAYELAVVETIRRTLAGEGTFDKVSK